MKKSQGVKSFNDNEIKKKLYHIREDFLKCDIIFF